MQRYFLTESADLNQRFFIQEKNDIHHISKVMRMQPEDHIVFTFNDEKVFKCEIIEISNEAIEVETIEALDVMSEMPVEVTILSGLIKADKYEWMLQKATELGAKHFIGTEMERNVVKLQPNKASKKLSRWEKIIKEAAEQSYRLSIPSIKYMSNFNEIYDNINQYDYVMSAYEESAKRGEVSHLKALTQKFKAGDKILFVSGPEGGFSENEIEKLTEVGCAVGLGPRILRAETAPLYVLSAISYELELMR